MTHGYLILLMINLGFMFPKVIYSWIIISSNGHVTHEIIGYFGIFKNVVLYDRLSYMSI